MTTIMDKKRALGRGLESLIPAARQTAPQVREVVREVPGEGIQEISVNEIEPSPYQPRRHKEEAQLKELAESIKVSGVMQPITVREVSAGIVRYTASDEDRPDIDIAIFGHGFPRPEVDPAKVKYQLIAGERRWLAS